MGVKSETAILFGKIMNVLHSYMSWLINAEDSEYLFVLAFTNLLMGISDPCEIENESNPLCRLKDDTINRIYGGTYPLAKKTASAFLSSPDLGPAELNKALNTFSESQKEGLAVDLQQLGFAVNEMTLGNDIFRIVHSLISAFSTGSNEAKYILKNQGNKKRPIPVSQVYVRDGRIIIGDEEIILPCQLEVTEEIQEHEETYIHALCNAYESASGVTVTPNTINQQKPRYQRHFKEQRKSYFSAESIQRSVREVFDKGKESYDALKEDVYDGISGVFYRDYDNGLARLNAVLDQAVIISIQKSPLGHIPNLIGNLERKGICHQLVNDQVIESWVLDDD